MILESALIQWALCYTRPIRDALKTIAHNLEQCILAWVCSMNSVDAELSRIPPRSANDLFPLGLLFLPLFLLIIPADLSVKTSGLYQCAKMPIDT